MHTKRWTIAGTALATLALTFSSIGVVAQDEMVGVPTAPTGYAELDQALNGDFAGTSVSFQTQWIGGEGANFAEAIANFLAATGIQIKVDSIGSSHETVLKARVDGGAPPDMAVLAQPSVITGEYGAGGKIVDIATIMDTEKLAAEHAATIGLYSTGDSIWAIPYKVDVKGVVWYPIKAFEAAGYTIPTTWDEWMALADQIVADGNGNPFCVGMNAGTATGWQATDLVEVAMLRTAGPEAYDKWISHELLFDSPEVRAALDLVAGIYFTPDYVLGGNTAIINIPQTEPMDPMFDAFDEEMGGMPGCWMHIIPFWYGPDFFPDVRIEGANDPNYVTPYTVGEEIGIFPIPPVTPELNPALGAGDGIMVFVDRPEVRAVAQFLSTPSGIETWVKKGAAISANTAVPAEWYEGNYESEVAAGLLASATSFRFDASDLMPAAVGAGSFWTEMVNWISANGENTDAVLQAIDASWPS